MHTYLPCLSPWAAVPRALGPEMAVAGERSAMPSLQSDPWRKLHWGADGWIVVWSSVGTRRHLVAIIERLACEEEEMNSCFWSLGDAAWSQFCWPHGSHGSVWGCRFCLWTPSLVCSLSPSTEHIPTATWQFSKVIPASHSLTNDQVTRCHRDHTLRNFFGQQLQRPESLRVTSQHR